MTGPAGRLRLHLSPAAARAVVSGHPWVFAGRIQRANREGKAGEIAALYDPRDRFIGLGLFDPTSPLRVRVLHRGEPVKLDDAWWLNHLESALARRAEVIRPETTGYRCIHGENDAWPGLVLDRYGPVCVLKLYTLAWLPWLEELAALFMQRLNPQTLVLRLSRNIEAAASPSLRDGQVMRGEKIQGPVVFLERGVRFEADVIRGQKTGFFLDQRDNRECVERLAAGAMVLNTFSFSGAFSVMAARGGAVSVTDVDISQHALESARRNFALNRDHPAIAAARHETVQGDVWDWLAEHRGKFDLVILDPPALARSQDERARALVAYRRLAALGAQRVRPGGLLLASSCSAHVGEEEFFEAVRTGVDRAGCQWSVLQISGQPADHPATFPEGRYLKAIYLRLQRRERRT